MALTVKWFPVWTRIRLRSTGVVSPRQTSHKTRFSAPARLVALLVVVSSLIALIHLSEQRIAKMARPDWRPDVVVGIDFGMTSESIRQRQSTVLTIIQVPESLGLQHQNGHDPRQSSAGPELQETAWPTKLIRCLHTTNAPDTSTHGDSLPTHIIQTFESKKTSSYSWIQSIATGRRMRQAWNKHDNGISITSHAYTNRSIAISARRYRDGTTETSSSSSASRQRGRIPA